MAALFATIQFMFSWAPFSLPCGARLSAFARAF
jgi:hypothetical protein